MMSKSTKVSRLPERPQPPIWGDIESDIAMANKDDVVFLVGKTNLPNVSAEIPKDKNNVPVSSASDTSDLDSSHYDPEEVQASYESVLRLIASHEHLASVPTSLREQYTNLQSLSQDMLGSISQLRELARSVKQDFQANRSQAGDSGHGKGKSARKKKK